MSNANKHFGTPEWLIVFGSGAFILVLGISAFWEPDIRWLHFFQAWMYMATILLSIRGSRWGYFIGIAVAGFWDYVNIFVVSFFFNGLEQLAHWIHSGHLARPDILIAVPAWFSNLLIIMGCAWAYARQASKSLTDINRFLVSVALSMAFFAADMALFQPRYLGIFRGLLHPHLP